MNNFRISAPSRVHMNLLSMGYDGYRKNGGLGFAISGWDTVFECVGNDSNSIIDLRRDALSFGEIEKLVAYLDKICAVLKCDKKLKVTIIEGPKPHSGLGVGTTTKLALVEALMIVNNRDASYQDIIKLSGRGGTSGIGINTYFYGGFILDGGVVINDEPFGPSSSKELLSFSLPQVLIKSEMPSGWCIGMLQISTSLMICGEKELDFFIKNTPISRAAIEAACYQAVMGVSVAVLEKDYPTFSKSINNIQRLSWKMAEWQQQDVLVNSAREWLVLNGAEAVGLSSFGPTLYFTHSSPSDIPTGACLPPCCELRLVTPNNFGRIVEYV